MTPGFSLCVAISAMLILDCLACSICGVRYPPTDSAELLDELRFVNFRGAGIGGLDFVGETGESGVDDLSSVGLSV